MRVGIDVRAALVNREGIGRYARELVRALLSEPGASDARASVEFRLFGTTLAPARAGLAALGLPHANAKLTRWRAPSRGVGWLLAATRLGVDDLVSFPSRCDVFHQTQPSMLRVRRAAEIVTAFDALFVHDAEGASPPGWVEPATARRMTDALRAAVARADSILVGCRWVADDVARHLGADPSRIRVTMLGCDHLPLAPRRAPGAPYVLTVARVDPRKNHARALRTFEALAAAGHPHRWILAGPPGWRSEEVERAIAASPVRDRIEWRRSADDGELAELYAGAALFLWPSLAEGYGLPPLEAMRAGVPVVASDRASLPEVLGSGARLVDPDDERGWIDASREILEDPAAAATLAERGRNRASELTWARTARETLAVYREASRAGERAR